MKPEEPRVVIAFSGAFESDCKGATADKVAVKAMQEEESVARVAVRRDIRMAATFNEGSSHISAAGVAARGTDNSSRESDVATNQLGCEAIREWLTASDFRIEFLEDEAALIAMTTEGHVGSRRFLATQNLDQVLRPPNRPPVHAQTHVLEHTPQRVRLDGL